MAFKFIDLDNFRSLMADEIKFDLNNESLYISKSLTKRGEKLWQHFLTEAVHKHDEVWLAEQLRNENLLNLTETYEKNGKVFERNAKINAPELLAESEFNRFYIRAVCLRAINKEKRVIVYRARESKKPRPASLQKTGQEIDPNSLLQDLRANKNVETFFGVALMGSGLSVTIEGVY